MPVATTYDMTGKETGTLELNDAVFGVKPNPTVVHSAVVQYLANQRQGTQSTRTRAEVRGGGKKPWRQKGTGHARQGSNRSPQWTHGGVALGPKPRDYAYILPKKVRRLALTSALSSKAADGGILVLDDMIIDEIKTKTVAALLNELPTGKKVLFVFDGKNDNAVLSARNIPGVRTTVVGSLNVYDVVNADTCVLLRDAVAKMEEVYA